MTCTWPYPVKMLFVLRGRPGANPSRSEFKAAGDPEQRLGRSAGFRP
jgi:hypothetical protein